MSEIDDHVKISSGMLGDQGSVSTVKLEVGFDPSYKSDARILFHWMRSHVPSGTYQELAKLMNEDIGWKVSRDDDAADIRRGLEELLAKYDRSGDHSHAGFEKPGNCIRCAITAALGK